MKIKVETNTEELTEEETEELTVWLHTRPWLHDKLIFYITKGKHKYCLRNLSIEKIKKDGEIKVVIE